MNSDIFIGIDMGSSSLKAVAFEAGSGAMLATAGGALPHTRRADGSCELAESAIRTALVQALRTLFADAAMRERMGRAGRLRVEREFDAALVYARYRALIRETVAP